MWEKVRFQRTWVLVPGLLVQSTDFPVFLSQHMEAWVKGSSLRTLKALRLYNSVCSFAWLWASQLEAKSIMIVIVQVQGA